MMKMRYLLKITLLKISRTSIKAVQLLLPKLVILSIMFSLY